MKIVISSFAPYQIGALLPPRVISTIITFNGSVAILLEMHHSLSCSFVVAQPTRTNFVFPSAGCSGSSVIEFSSFGGSWPIPRDVKFGIFVASSRFSVEMSMPPFLANTGDHE